MSILVVRRNIDIVEALKSYILRRRLALSSKEDEEKTCTACTLKPFLTSAFVCGLSSPVSFRREMWAKLFLFSLGPAKWFLESFNCFGRWSNGKVIN